MALIGCSDDPGTTSTSSSSATSSSDATTTTTTGTGGSGGGATTTTTTGTGGAGGGVIVDDPPGSPSAFVATLVPTPFGVDLAWQAPSDADLAGYLVTRSLVAPQAGDVGPADGLTYMPGDAVGDYGQAVFVGSALAAQDLAEGPGAGVENYYAVWAVDQAGQYSLAPATDDLAVPIPPQAATIEIASPTTNPVVTVTLQPLYANVKGTATYDAVTGLTLNLSVENRAARIVFNQKAILDAVSDAAAVAASDGTDMNGDVAAYYGPEAMDVGAAKARDIIFTGALGTVDPIVIDLHLASNAAAYLGDDYNATSLLIHDLSGAKTTAGTVFGGTTTFSTVGYKPGVGCLRPGVFSEDGRFFYSGHKNMPTLITLDMTTLTAVAGTDLSTGTTGLGFTSGVIMSPDGQFLYAAVTTGGHQFTGAGSNPVLDTATRDIDFVKVDRATMAEVGRVSLLVDAAPVVDENTHYPKAADPSITPDGARAVVPIHGTGMIWVVDLATMTLIDTDAATAGVQGIDASATTIYPRLSAVSPDGAKAYVGSNHGVDEIVVVDLAAYTTATILSTSTAGQNGYGWTGMSFGPTDGKLYMSRPWNNNHTAFSVFDPTLQTHKDVISGNFDIMGLGFSPDGSRFYAFDRSNVIQAFDTATAAQIDVDGDPVNGVSSFATLDIDEGHATGVTPF